MTTIEKHNSYSLLRHLVYLSFFLCLCQFPVFAKPQFVFQSENPIANFAWTNDIQTIGNSIGRIFISRQDKK